MSITCIFKLNKKLTSDWMVPVYKFVVYSRPSKLDDNQLIDGFVPFNGLFHKVRPSSFESNPTPYKMVLHNEFLHKLKLINSMYWKVYYFASYYCLAKL